MKLLLPGYEHQIVQGAGLSVGPGAPKVGVHTTETKPGSIDPLIRHWRNNWGSGLPHFVQEGNRVVQLLPLNVGAYTAKNRPGGADINRSGPMVQIEVVSFSAEGWDDVTYETFGKWLADVQTAGHDFDIGSYPRFYGPNEGVVLAREDSPIRFTARQFDEFNGWLGHQHFPENDHWDPGGIDPIRIERIARYHLAGTQPIPDIPEPEEDVPATIEANKNAKQIWITSGCTKRYVLETSRDGVPHEQFIEAAKARGYVDNTGRDDGAVFLSQLKDVSDPVVSPT